MGVFTNRLRYRQCLGAHSVPVRVETIKVGQNRLQMFTLQICLKVFAE